MEKATTDIGPAKMLLIAVREYLDEHYPHWKFAGLADGLRLEMHPRVPYAVSRQKAVRHAAQRGSSLTCEFYCPRCKGTVRDG